MAFLATLLFRHRSNLDFPEEIGIPRSGPLCSSAAKKRGPDGHGCRKNVCKPNSKRCLGRGTWPYAVFSRLKTIARDVLRNRYEQMSRTKALQDILGRISHKPKRRLDDAFPDRTESSVHWLEPENHHLPMRIKHQFFFPLFSTCSKRDIVADSPELMCRKNMKKHLGSVHGTEHPRNPKQKCFKMLKKAWKYLHEPPKGHLFFSSWTRDSRCVLVLLCC